MKSQNRVLTLIMIFMLVLGLSGFGDTKGEAAPTVAQQMRNISKTMGGISKDLGEGRYYDVALKFIDLATIFHDLRDRDQKYGPEKEWKEIMESLVRLSLKGVGACGEENKEAVQNILKEMNGLKMQGHSIFR